MARRVLLLLLCFDCLKRFVSGTAATPSDKKQTISFGPNHHYVANGSQLILNCTSWNDNLSSYNLCWRFENKAWLNDHTTRLDARTVQLYNPNVTYDNNGTYQCCLCNATLLSSVVECNQTDVVFIGEKPDVGPSDLGAQLSPYGCPPELMELSWKAVPSNGELLEYDVWYQMGNMSCPRSHMKRAGWCTRHSSSSDASFSCDLKRVVNRSYGQKVCLEFGYWLCWSISVTNRFGTAYHLPNYTDLVMDILCPRPTIRLWTSGRGEITVEIDLLKQLLGGFEVIYKVTFCYLGTGFSAKEVGELHVAMSTKIQFTRSNITCESFTTSVGKTFKLVKTKLGSLEDYSQYAVSVSGKIVSGPTHYGLVAGPKKVTTLEQAPAKAPSLQRTSSLTSCGYNKTVAVHFQLPPFASWRGRPRQFVVEYWQTGNQTRMNKTFPTNVRQLTSSATLSANFTVECLKEYKVRMRMCTVECGEWSTAIFIRADEQSSTLVTFRQKDTGQSWIWKLAVSVGVFCGILPALVLFTVCIYYRRKRTDDSSENAPPLQSLADRTLDIVPMSEDGVNMPPLNESTGQYEQPSIADDDSIQESVDSTSPLV